MKYVGEETPRYKLDPIAPAVVILPKLTRVYRETNGDEWREYDPRTGAVVRVGKLERAS